MWKIYFGYLVLAIIIALAYLIITYVVSHWFKRDKKVGQVIFLIVALFLLKNFFIASYCNPSSSSANEGVILWQYNPDESYTVCEIEKWINTDDLGWIYIKRIDAVDDYQIRLFYREPGLLNEKWYDVDMVIKDNKDNIFTGSSSGGHTAFISSTVCIDFKNKSKEGVLGDQFELILNGKLYELN